MKKNFCLMMCLLALTCTTMMTSCSKEKDDDKINPELLIGKWKMNFQSYVIEDRNSDPEYYFVSFVEDVSNLYITFMGNNVINMPCLGIENGNYTFDGENITLYLEGGRISGVVKKLTSKELIFDISGDGTGFNYDYMYFVCDRIN